MHIYSHMYSLNIVIIKLLNYFYIKILYEYVSSMFAIDIRIHTQTHTRARARAIILLKSEILLPLIRPLVRTYTHVYVI